MVETCSNMSDSCIDHEDFTGVCTINDIIWEKNIYEVFVRLSTWTIFIKIDQNDKCIC